MNLYDIPGGRLPGELVEILARGGNVRVERIVSDGQVSGWYDQKESEFVALLAGSARLEFACGKAVEMRPGDTLLIPPHEKHRVTFTSEEPKCIWLCVFW